MGPAFFIYKVFILQIAIPLWQYHIRTDAMHYVSITIIAISYS